MKGIISSQTTPIFPMNLKHYYSWKFTFHVLTFLAIAYYNLILLIHRVSIGIPNAADGGRVHGLRGAVWREQNAVE